jgi:hypothetical protein
VKPRTMPELVDICSPTTFTCEFVFRQVDS